MVRGCAVQLASIGVPNEEPKRRELRELLFRSEGIENYIRRAPWSTLHFISQLS